VGGLGLEIPSSKGLDTWKLRLAKEMKAVKIDIDLNLALE
jgi:hypothetical protein